MMKRCTKYVWAVFITAIIMIFIVNYQHKIRVVKERKSLKGKILFSVGRDDLYVIDLVSQEVSKVEIRKFNIYFPSYPCWMPNREQIILSNYRENYGVITILDVANNSVKEYPEIKLDCDFISLSPNGKEVAFMGRIIGSGENKYKLYILSLSDNKLTLASDMAAGPYKPSWSPDGRKIAFTSIDNNIYVLADNKTELIIKNGVGPEWSPNGDKILYRSTYYIYIFDLNSKKNKSIITNYGFNDVIDYTWSPDSKYIVFKKLTDSISPIEILSIKSDNIIRLNEYGNVKGICWKY